ncbi:hypothetical protein ACHWQZ_G013341 [Mnemiopsis leidyi]
MMERRIVKKGYVLGVFLDIEAAFDNVSFKAVAEAIHKTKLDPATAQWIINTVSNRYITINNKEATKTISLSPAKQTDKKPIKAVEQVKLSQLITTIKSSTKNRISSRTTAQPSKLNNQLLRKHTTTLRHTNKHIIIWTDSLSSIQALTTLNNNSRTVTNCLYSLNHLGANNNLELRWIAAHTGLWGNEKADELARLGTTSNLTLKRPVPHSNINNYINNKDYRTAVQLITGHCGLNKHLINMRKSDTKECPLCGHQEETVSHFLGQCPATAQLRGHNFNEYNLSINDIFYYTHISTIIKFTNKTKRLLDPEDIDNTGVT